MTDKILAQQGNMLMGSIQREHAETASAIQKMGKGINNNIKEMQTNVMKGFGEIEGLNIETRNQLKA